MKKRRAKAAVPDTPGCPESPYDTMSKRNIRARWSPALAPTILHKSSGGDTSQNSALMMAPPTPLPQQVAGAEASQPTSTSTDDFVMVSVSEATPPDGTVAAEASAR